MVKGNAYTPQGTRRNSKGFDPDIFKDNKVIRNSLPEQYKNYE